MQGFYIGTTYSILLAIAYHDIKTHTIPLFGCALLMGMGTIYGLLAQQLYTHFLGAIIGAGIFLLISVLGKYMCNQPVLGEGDWLLMGTIGWCYGLNVVIRCIYLSFIVGGILAIALLAFRLKTRKDTIPFAPAIVLATAMALITG